MKGLINNIVFNIGFIKRQHLLEIYWTQFAVRNKKLNIKRTKTMLTMPMIK